MSVARRRERIELTRPECRVSPYLLRDLAIVWPNQVWCAGITYIPLRRSFLYPLAIMDWHSRRVQFSMAFLQMVTDNGVDQHG